MNEVKARLVSSPNHPEVSSTELNQEDFVPISLRGFGDGWNSYLQGMTWFEGRLYCGTYRASSCILMMRPKDKGRPKWSPCPVKCPEGDLFEEVDVRPQIWRFDPAAAHWEYVHRAPTVKADTGRDIPREIAYRGMAVLQGKCDPKPVLYVTPYTNKRKIGPVILRSEDGKTFEPVGEPGLGYEGVTSLRFLVAFKGHVYTSPVGVGGQPNWSRSPTVLESDDPAGGEWRPVSLPGFGDPNNVVVSSMAVLGDHLYAGTGNPASGFQLWKTDAEGTAPFEWKKVLEFGAYRGNFNEGVLTMCPFKDALYLGTCIQDGGFDRINRIGPAAGEVIRVHPNNSWDLVVGAARLVRGGVKIPTSGLQPGFNDLRNGYIWRMCVHEGRLYIGTLNWATYMRYIDLRQWPTRIRELVEAIGLEAIIERRAGFDLWSTADGDHFIPVTVSGFGNPYNSGARTLVSTPYGIAVGTANAFGPEVAVKRGGSWEYVPNPRGGAEVWLGSANFPKAIRQMRPPGAEGTAESYRLPPVDTDPARRMPDIPDSAEDSSRFEFDTMELQQRARRIDLDSVSAEPLAEARELFGLREEGIEHVPQTGAVLLLGNNPAVWLFAGGTVVAAHALYTLDAIARRRGQPGWLLTSLKYFEIAQRVPGFLPALERLGLVPATKGNGARLLELGEAVLGYPEKRPSRPPYQMRTFAPDYVRMAWETGAPIVPVAFVGTHESHLLIEHKEQQIRVNKGKRLRSNYLIKFLPPIDVREHLQMPDDTEALEAFSEFLRKRIQVVVDSETERRPLVQVARKLQREYGTSGTSDQDFLEFLNAFGVRFDRIIHDEDERSGAGS